MTTITQDDLKMAALAAGHFVEPGLPPQALVRTYRDGDKMIEVYREWRPHTDIADAARLAVRLGMMVEVTDYDVHAALYRDRAACTETHDGSEADKLRAYCEAVTKLAAAIGRRMREGQR